MTSQNYMPGLVTLNGLELVVTPLKQPLSSSS